MQDRNFDDLADKFSQNIYGTRKGLVRQAILWDELDALLPTLPDGPLNILDAGGVGIGYCCATSPLRCSNWLKRMRTLRV